MQEVVSGIMLCDLQLPRGTELFVWDSQTMVESEFVVMEGQLQFQSTSAQRPRSRG